MNEFSIIEIITTLTSFSAVIISLLCYTNSRRELFINAYAEYRTEWIKNVRMLLLELVECKTQKADEDKLFEVKHKIDIYLNFKYKDHKSFSKSINLLIKNKISIDEVIYESQILIDNYWKKAKNEARMGKWTNRRIRKKTYGDTDLFD